jgi:hypothetical protein
MDKGGDGLELRHLEGLPLPRDQPTWIKLDRWMGVEVENSDPSCGDRFVLVDEPTEQILPSDLGDPRSRINGR